jgi:osmotically-inducible protein OsmY
MLSDTDIRDAVIFALRSSGILDWADIGVDVDHGVVTLTGTVEGYGEHAVARASAFGVNGVIEVVNRLKVVLHGPAMLPGPPSD